MRNQKGITLIALVITIIVLLILAGVTIAMLSGENGILSRSTETRSTNAEAQATEEAKLAYMTVRTEIASKMTQDGNYSPVDNTGEVDAKITGDKTLLATVKSDLGFSGTPTTGWITVEESVDGTIRMVYSDSSLEKNLEYTIVMSTTSPYATFNGPTKINK